MNRRLGVLTMVVLMSVLGISIAHSSSASALAGQQVTVTMKDFEFGPKTVTIKVGDSIVWNNAGTKKHTATADDNSFDTGVVAPGASSQPIKFDKAGSIPYYCQFHGGPGGVDMAGVITVTADGGAPQAATAEATTVPPTVAPAATAPAATTAPVAAAKSVGTLTFADKAKGAHADSLTISFTALPLPEEGKQYEAWLSNGKDLLSLGAISVKADGTATLSYADPKGANLINVFNAVLVSLQGTALAPIGPIAFSGYIPPQADVHVKHVMAKFPDTPDNAGLITGALDQESILTQHVGFMNQAIKNNNLAVTKLHLEHIHNILTGKTGAKDLNGNGKLEVTPPGDGFGIFNYLTLAIQHADLASKQPDATDNIKVKASHIKITVINATGLFTQIQTLAVQAASKTTVNDIKPLADQITKLNDGAVKGVADATGGISPTKGSGGLATAYTEGLAMASITIVAGDVTGGQSGQPAVAATAGATTAPVADVNTVTIVMKDFDFADKAVTIPVGSSVVFVNQGTKKHTATADDNSFDTGVVAPGATSKPIKFDKPGVIPFYCQFHGGPGGVAMSGVITVK